MKGSTGYVTGSGYEVVHSVVPVVPYLSATQSRSPSDPVRQPLTYVRPSASTASPVPTSGRLPATE